MGPWALPAWEYLLLARPPPRWCVASCCRMHLADLARQRLQGAHWQRPRCAFATCRPQAPAPAQPPHAPPGPATAAGGAAGGGGGVAVSSQSQPAHQSGLSPPGMPPRGPMPGHPSPPFLPGHRPPPGVSPRPPQPMPGMQRPAGAYPLHHGMMPRVWAAPGLLFWTQPVDCLGAPWALLLVELTWLAVT